MELWAVWRCLADICVHLFYLTMQTGTTTACASLCNLLLLPAALAVCGPCRPCVVRRPIFTGPCVLGQCAMCHDGVCRDVRKCAPPASRLPPALFWREGGRGGEAEAGGAEAAGAWSGGGGAAHGSPRRTSEWRGVKYIRLAHCVKIDYQSSS
jgi:hypothetical protein